MIVRCPDWDSLLATLRAAGVAGFDGTPGPAARAVLAGPCAIAWWIAQRAPELARSESLSILILGAEAADAPDEGRWYQLLPLLLDAHFSVAVTLVGLELDRGFGSSLARHAPQPAAEAHRQSLGAFLLGRGDAVPDLAFAFHPGLQKHRAWLEADGFPTLLDRGVPLVCAAYESDEQEMERWVVEAYGYRADAMPLLNPFYLDLSDDKTAIRWGRALWRIEAPPVPGASVDEPRLRALETLNRMVMHSLSAGGAPSPLYGAAVELSGSGGERRALIHVCDNRFLDPATGEVVELAGGALTPLKRVPPAVAAVYPGTGASELERAIWAAGIKADYLLDTYPRAPLPEPADVAAGMLATLRRKAATLFRGGR